MGLLGIVKNQKALIGMIALCIVPVCVATGQVSSEDLAKIESAVPQRASVEPVQPRTILVFSKTAGYQHGSIPHGIVAFEILGRKTGAFDTVVSEDISMFEPDNLAQFDAVVFLNTTGALFDDPELKASFMGFVKNGKGVIGIHAATDCFYDWPEFGTMMGGYFDGHPGGANTTVTLKIDDPGHAVNRVFSDGEPFTITDEIYQIKEPYSRENLRVLTSIDVGRTDMNKSGIKRSDNDYAVSWVRSYGKGRVFYCSLGHRNDIFWNPTVLQHYLDGIQFAMGDLSADTTPSAFVGQAIGDILDQAFAEASHYDYGRSRLPLSTIAEAVRVALVDDPSTRDDVVVRLLNLLTSDESTVAAKDFVCRQLALIGGDESVPALAALLPNPALSHMARYALERIPGPVVDAALREALTEIDDESLLVGVVNSVAKRHDEQASGALYDISLRMNNPELSQVATIALINCVDLDLLPALADAYWDLVEYQDSKPGQLDSYCEVFTEAADRLIQTGRTDDALKIYANLYEETEQERFRLASLVGLAEYDPVETVPMIAELLGHDESLWSGTAARLIATSLPGDEVIEKFVSLFPSLDASAQVALLGALAERGDRAALPIAKMAVESADADVSRAGIEAMGSIGDESVVVLLAEIAANTEGDDNPARESLDRMPGEDIDLKIARSTGRIPPYNKLLPANVRGELARSIGARRAKMQAPALLMLIVRDEDESVRVQAFDSLGDVALIAHLGFMVEPLAKAQSEEERSAAEESIIQASQRLGHPDYCAKPFAAALLQVDVKTKPSFIRVLGGIGGPIALEAVRESLIVQDEVVYQTAIDVLIDWPSAEVFDVLLSLASVTSDTDLHRRLIEGGVRAAGLADDRSADEHLDLYSQLLEGAINDVEVRAILEGMSIITHPAAIDLVAPYLENDTVKTTAAGTMISIATAVAETDREAAMRGIELALNACPENVGLHQQAGAAINTIERDDDYIKTWLFAGPYLRDQTGGGALLDIPFDPETSGEDDVKWTPVPDRMMHEPGWVNLLAMNNGSNRCAYLRTRIWVPVAQEARFEVGSDDGIKVWLNGQVVHANNAMRGLSLGQDTFSAPLTKGWNTLLMKITQGGGDWRAACRIRDANGYHVGGIRVER